MHGYAYHDPHRVNVGGKEKPMHHPTNRAERRFERERIIARRRHIWGVVWKGFCGNSFNNPLTFGSVDDWSPYQWTPDWGRYAKWNLGCGCKQCHRDKYYKCKSQRRSSRKLAMSQVECRVGDRKYAKNVCGEEDFHSDL